MGEVEKECASYFLFPYEEIELFFFSLKLNRITSDLIIKHIFELVILFSPKTFFNVQNTPSELNTDIDISNQ